MGIAIFLALIWLLLDVKLYNEDVAFMKYLTVVRTYPLYDAFDMFCGNEQKCLIAFVSIWFDLSPQDRIFLHAIQDGMIIYIYISCFL